MNVQNRDNFFTAGAHAMADPGSRFFSTKTGSVKTGYTLEKLDTILEN